jgi:hypothetical protein
MGEFMEHLAAVFSTGFEADDAFQLLFDEDPIQTASVYFPENENVRVSIDWICRDCDYDVPTDEFAGRVAACINSCLGVPTDLVEQNTLSDLLAIRHQRDELLALAVRSEFELATCADRGAGDVDHGLLPALRALIAKIKGQDHGG